MYQAPVTKLSQLLLTLGEIDQAFAWRGLNGDTQETTQSILDAFAKFAHDKLAPLNSSGDQTGCLLKEGQVHTPHGFQAAFEAWIENGWQGLKHPVEVGGEGLPYTLAAACAEILHASNLSFGLCPLLTDGAIEALRLTATTAQQERYIPHLLDGRMTGTMNLTEPQAGSDLSLIQTKAKSLGGERYAIFGTKIFITYGDHDLAPNILHLVLARTEGAPKDLSGLSLFACTKYRDIESEKPSVRNGVNCTHLEHKLGIHASPTCVLQFEAAEAELIGEPGQGLVAMFRMMNASRYAVGLQGLGVAEAACQQAEQYANERRQGRSVDPKSHLAAPVLIQEHPDVRRMLWTMRSQVDAVRAFALLAALEQDKAHYAPDAVAREIAQARFDLMVPAFKGFATEVCQEVVNLSLQVHGGMGYIEETGIAQLLRDARILTIYEGTTAIQAHDLMARKTAKDQGAVAKALIAEIQDLSQTLTRHPSPAHQRFAAQLKAAALAWKEVIAALVVWANEDPERAYGSAVNYLMLTGYVLSASALARVAKAESELSIATTFFGDVILQRCAFLKAQILDTPTPPIFRST